MEQYYLQKGQRGLLIGQTGSGKTQNGFFHLQNTHLSPVIIFDTKIDPAFLSIGRPGDFVQLVENFDDFTRASRLPAKERPDYLIARPALNELQDSAAMDAYTFRCYESFGSAFFFFDEIYQWHDGGKAGNGLVGLLTRGRSRGKTVLMATQRPAWLSRFCLTESQKFYLHLLNDSRDKKTLGDVIPEFARYPDPPKYHFYFYEVGSGEKPLLCNPVPLAGVEQAAPNVSRFRWV